MDIMLERIVSLWDRKHGAKKKLAEYLGISPNVVTDWVGGRNKSYVKHAPKIAEYYGVSLSWLSGEEEQKEKTPTLTKKDERDIARQLESIMQEMTQGSDLMFDGNPMSEEAIESIMAAMKLGLEAAKMKNKERFTPKKHREE